jgi:hypothetical protein
LSDPFIVSSQRAGGYPTGLIQCIHREILEAELHQQDPSGKFSDLRDITDLGISCSVGGITLGAMASGLSASDTTDLFIDAGPKLFPTNWYRNITQLFDYKYDMGIMKGILDNAFGDTTLEDCLPMKLAIGVLDLNTLEPLFITNYPVSESFGKFRPGTKLADIVRVGVAVPPFYPPQAIELIDSHGDSEILDGLDLAVVTNDPIEYGVKSAKNYAHEKDIRLYAASAAIAPPEIDEGYDYLIDNKLNSQHNFAGIASLLNIIALNRQGLDKKAIKGALHQLNADKDDSRIHLFHIDSRNYSQHEKKQIIKKTGGGVTPISTDGWGLFRHDDKMHRYMLYRIGEKARTERHDIQRFVHDVISERLSPGGDHVSSRFPNSAIEVTLSGDGQSEIVGSYDPKTSGPPVISPSSNTPQ